MGKVAQDQVKYVVKAHLEASGLVEKPDIVGAIFGQTEGLLGDDLDLRELQERGRVGRIDVQVEERNGSSEAEIRIPTSLDATETALIGAALETIERVGPTTADIEVDEIRDERTSKRDYIVKRAKQLLEDIEQEKPQKEKITEEVKQEVRTSELSEFRGFKAGPDAKTSEEIVLVEGRADLLNLLKHGVKNTVAIGGTDIPEKIQEIDEEKDITAFLDGDRGGDLILKELKEKAEPELVARAPENREVEELGKEEIYKALRDKSPVEYEETGEAEEEGIDEELRESLQEQLNELIGTRAAHLLDSEMETLAKCPVSKLENELKKIDSCFALVADTEIDRELIQKAEKKAEYVVGMERGSHATSSDTDILTRQDLKQPRDVKVES